MSIATKKQYPIDVKKIFFRTCKLLFASYRSRKVKIIEAGFFITIVYGNVYQI
jgi:hypothetical protein